MAKSLIKQVEGVIAIVIFISFLSFYFLVYYNSIGSRIDLNNEISYYKQYVNKIFNSINSQYYLVSFNVSVPVSMYYQCIYKNVTSYAYKDFCTNFPIFYPLNISFLTTYSGVLNNTNDTYLDPNVGLFFYLNISNLNFVSQPQYVLINISNPSNKNLNNYPVFITSPVVFYWLQSGYNLNITDLSGNQYYFCYLNYQFNCSNINNKAYGVWVNVNISKNSYIILNISPILTNNPYSVDGSQIFPFYDHFVYQNYREFSLNWNNDTKIEVDYLDPGNEIYSTSYGSFTISSKRKINKGYYLALFNINKNSYLASGNINIGKSCDISLKTYSMPYFYYCNVGRSTDISISTSYGSIDAYYLVLIPYDVIPQINIIYQPNISQTFNFIVGPNLNYDFSRYSDLKSGMIYTSLGSSYAIYNKNTYGLVYFSYGGTYYSIPTTYVCNTLTTSFPNYYFIDIWQ
ncbi:MAG: hypothetical protein ACP5G1_02910, partial [Nanopusillaceae archaeon]